MGELYARIRSAGEPLLCSAGMRRVYAKGVLIDGEKEEKTPAHADDFTLTWMSVCGIL